MLCPTCGRELGTELRCSSCEASAPSDVSEPLPSGDAFLAARPLTFWQRAKPAILVVTGLLLWLAIVRLNYIRAIRWAGSMTAEASGYMMGGCLVSLLLGLFAMFLVAKIRGKKSAKPTRFFGVSAVAFLVSFLSFAGSLQHPQQNLKHEVGDLLRQAAGNRPATADVNWWDGPSRDFFRDILTRNEQYIAEVKALDNSAIKDLYSADSYAGEVHMQKVVTQLRAVYDVDTKYTSLEPVLNSLKARVAVAHASETEKQDFLKGVDESVDRMTKPRTDLMSSEKIWMDNTLDLYQFMVAHSSDYSIRDTKLYFADNAVRKKFSTLQSKAVTSHKDFLKAKAAFEDYRKNSLNQLGVSPSEFTPSQLGKAH